MSNREPLPVTRCTPLAEELFVHHGTVNVGILRHGNRALLIDFGDGSVMATVHDLGIEIIDTVLFTHHHRDQASGAVYHLPPETRIGVPEAERECFESVAELWNTPARRWHLYDFHPDNLVLTQPLKVDLALQAGDTLHWGRANLTVIATPGHTNGSVSYLVDLGQAGRFIFSGDLIYDAGKVGDVYSLQKGTQTRDYHGFLGARAELERSLGQLRGLAADALIPSHGVVMRDPRAAIDLLRERLQSCYDAYAATSALRYYFPALFTEHEGRLDGLKRQPTFAYPAFLRHTGTTWLILSADGAAFAADCGSDWVVSELVALQRAGVFGVLEGLWISHYHDDHVDGIPALQAQFGCPIFADAHVSSVIEHPAAWNLPCLSPLEIKVDRVTEHGETWQWHEFAFTAYHLPGQTLYHGGLLVEGHGHRILLAGDSFTPTGIDDYCALNRNPLGEGVGFDACLALLKELKPDIILNAHVDEAFSFDEAAVPFIRDNLRLRETLFGALLPWAHPNQGLDPSWIRCHPYEQRAMPGDVAELSLVVTNDSGEMCTVAARPELLGDWELDAPERRLEIAPRSEGRADFRLRVPTELCPGRWVIPIDITCNGVHLGPIREALLVIA